MITSLCCHKSDVKACLLFYINSITVIFTCIGPYNTTYPGYGQASTQSATNTGQAGVSQTQIASNATAAAANTVGYIPATPVASNMTPSAQAVIPANVASSTPQTAGINVFEAIIS